MRFGNPEEPHTPYERTFKTLDEISSLVKEVVSLLGLSRSLSITLDRSSKGPHSYRNQWKAGTLSCT